MAASLFTGCKTSLNTTDLQQVSPELIAEELLLLLAGAMAALDTC